MTDPYEILNVPSTATDEEVKKAYRDLARKYHPDNYHDNPLADLAQEKMKEINAAYDAIQKERSGRARSGGGYARSGGYQYQSQSQGGYQSQAREGAAVFQQVRMAINRNDLGMAEQLLRQDGPGVGGPGPEKGDAAALPAENQLPIACAADGFHKPAPPSVFPEVVYHRREQFPSQNFFHRPP